MTSPKCQEQSLGIDQINRAEAEMNSLTQHNASGAEELASIMAMFKTNHTRSLMPSTGLRS